MDKLALKLTALTRVVEIEDERNNTTVEYELREMKAAERDKYLTQFAARCIRTAKGDIGSLENFDGAEAELIIRTLFVKETGKPVEKKIVQDWPAGTVSQLFKAAFELNKLGATANAKKDGAEEPEPKND